MHNWRFLLLAFVAVIQPIASYTERGPVDGRQQRCDYRTASVLRDPGLSFHGTHRFSKPAVEDRRLNERADIREIQRNEVRKVSFRTISSSDRERGDTLERGDSTSTSLGRASQTEFRFARDGVVLRRESRGLQLGDSRKERSQEFRAERPSTTYVNNRVRLDSRLSSNRLSEDERRSQFRINDRLSMDMRRDTRADQGNTQTRRSQETREKREWARDDITRSSRTDRRISRDTAQKMDTTRSEFRVQLNQNANLGKLDQRFMNRELTSSPVSSTKAYRTSNNDDLRVARATRATQSLDRDDRRNTQLRQYVDEHTQQRDIHRNRVANNRDSVSADQRSIRQAATRTGKTANLRSRRTSESRREVSRRDIGSSERDQSVGNRLESRHAERDTRRTKEIRLVENRLSQNTRRDSRILERKRSVENRRDARDTRGMERNLRSLERVAETRREARLADRDRDSNNRNEYRSVRRESRMTMTDRVGINSNWDSKRSTVVGCTALKNNKGSCTINRERSPDRVMANRDYERVAIARALSADRFAENRRNTRDLVGDYRIAGLERATDNQRDRRNLEREAKQAMRNQIAEVNIRTNIRDIGSIEREQSGLYRRDNYNTENRIVRVEHNNKKEARNVQERARSLERAIHYQRTTRGNEKDVRNIRLNRFSEAQNSRNTDGESRVPVELFESRRDRQYRSIEQERVTAHRRAIRSVDTNVRTIRAGQVAESRNDVRKESRNSRMFRSERLAESRRESSSEHRRNIRNVEKETRAMRTEEMRGGESRIINIARSRDLSMERKDHRMTERLNMRDTQLDRRSRSAQRESRAETRYTFERNNGELERREGESQTRKQEFLSMIRNPSKDENVAPVMTWQYIFYTLQGLYICGVLTQLMNENSAVKKTRAFSWWSSPQHPIKVD